MVKDSYIKTDNNKVINEKYIRWIHQHMNDCFEVCTRSDGCSIENGNTHKVCKFNSPTSYNKLNNLFDQLVSNLDGSEKSHNTPRQRIDSTHTAPIGDTHTAHIGGT